MRSTLLVSSLALVGLAFAPRVAHAQVATGTPGDVTIGTPSAEPPPPPQVLVQQPPPPPPGQPPVVYMMQPSASSYYMTRPRPYLGGPVPPGMHLASHPNIGLLVGGAVTFGVPWFFSFLVGTTGAAAGMGDWGWLAVPVFGPLIFSAADCCLSAGTVGLMIIDSVVQAGGVAMFVAGLLVPRRELVPNGYGSRAVQGPSFAVLPVAPGASGGASVALRF